TMIFPYAENFPLQWVSDWGIGVGVAALVGFAFFARRAFAASVHESLASGLAAGVTALLLQNLIDLGLEIFAIFALALVAFTGFSRPPRAVPRPIPGIRYLGPAGVGVMTLVVLLTGAMPVRFERERVSKDYQAWVRNGGHEPRRFLKEIRASMLRHPGEAYFPLVGSFVAARAGGDPLK